jgi:hypothetical protein
MRGGEDLHRLRRIRSPDVDSTDEGDVGPKPKSDCVADEPQLDTEASMWWGIGFGGFFLYLILLIVLGVRTLRNGHGWLFFFGIFIPLLWLIGALMRPSGPQYA